ncbi:adenylate/guanylate cyclase domain-containing protein [Aurantimonas sp. VKM B-3413]|uniref:adenylate/guanylate cyclase domain-containing protein n=1 Tax=Aurantimonas sp. VKM B-3413 TaxID=2779401 RepID=UPI001E31E203|nr:adenylate/guanylate cyclase domain-containing protein [Aurantimonas sp. VKM B-3413]MCB8840226.1 adenylate/guanylate cyclase domain-containing protein [Aurantimonas sp. VKM B-3413]
MYQPSRVRKTDGGRPVFAGNGGPPAIAAADDAAAVQELIEWLAGEECHDLDAAGLARCLGERLRAAGLPVDGLTLHLGTLYPEFMRRSITWSPGKALVSQDRLSGTDVNPGFGDSTVLRAMESGMPQTLRLGRSSKAVRTGPNVNDGRDVVEFIALPLRNSDGLVNAASFSTERSDGFSAWDRRVLDRVRPALRNVCELLAHKTTELVLLETYVGATTAGRVMAGHVRRGEFEALDAGLLLCDLRGFTELSNRLPGQSMLELLNAYFDRVVPAITEAGGEVIKFMGDAALAFFSTGDAASSCIAALGGALKALEGVSDISVDGVTLRAGVALHYGKVGYGNIGSGRRLDFTVIGRDVNLVSRIQSVCSASGIPLLMSERFATLIAPTRVVAIGCHVLPGFVDPVELYTTPCLFAPARARAGETTSRSLAARPIPIEVNR